MLVPSFRLAAVVALLLVARQARAQGDETSLFRASSTTLFAQLGLGTPLGYAGAELEQSVISSLVLSVGAGMGAVGPQVAFMPRIRVAGATSALVLGAGVSYGKYRDDVVCGPLCDGSDVREGKVVWLNVEAAVEHRWTNGLTLRGFIGGGHGVSSTMVCVSRGGCGQAAPRALTLVYPGGAIGWSF